ncbi:MAG TPA: SDR family oxidoreductase [Kofleriaceae bacterium]|nr:SDR family oxidoreductase [Kofleriaceae bacterium]
MTARERIVVFGGGSGVGLAAAKLLAARGAEVIIAGRELGSIDGFRTYAVDGKDVAAIEAFFEQVGAIDHLVITAGATNRGGSFVDDITDASFRATFDGKFWVQVNVAQRGARRVRKGGSITLFSGGANRRALRGMVNVAAVNGALDAIVPTLAVELAPTRVNSISPGTLRTTYWAGMPDQQLEQIFSHAAAGLPAGRVGTADDIARAVQFVIDSEFMTGTVLCIDGGLPHSSL